MLLQILLAFALNTEARINSPLLRRASYPYSVATFNNYAAQSNTNCGPMAGQPGTYGAAASDVSPDISGGKCSGSINLSNCNGQSPIDGAGPTCPKTNCGKCYKVTNQGAIPVTETIGGIGNSVIVQIIDSCPQTNPQNYCKTDMAANQRCEDPNTNQLDIDQSAYEALTGQAFGSGPNLQILIEDSDCSGGTDQGPAASSSTPPPASSPPPAASSSTAPPASSLPPAPVAASPPQSATSLPAPSPPPAQPVTSPSIVTGPYTNGSSSSPSSPLQINPVQEVNGPPAQGLQINEDDAVTEEKDDDYDECSDEDVDTS